MRDDRLALALSELIVKEESNREPCPMGRLGNVVDSIPHSGAVNDIFLTTDYAGRVAISRGSKSSPPWGRRGARLCGRGGSFFARPRPVNFNNNVVAAIATKRPPRQPKRLPPLLFQGGELKNRRSMRHMARVPHAPNVKRK